MDIQSVVVSRRRGDFVNDDLAGPMPLSVESNIRTRRAVSVPVAQQWRRSSRILFGRLAQVQFISMRSVNGHRSV